MKSKWVWLTAYSTKQKVLVNMSHVECMYPDRDEDYTNLSGIGNNGGLRVKETPQQIIDEVFNNGITIH